MSATAPMSPGPYERESEQILSALASVLQRRKLILGVCLFGVLAPVVYYNQTAAPVYEATASVVFEELRGPLPEDVSVNITRELYLFNRIEEINSRAFAEDVAAALPAGVLARFPAAEGRPPGLDRMRNVSQLLEEGISAFPVRGSNIVRIRVRLSDPDLCVVVADLCLKVLEERTSEVRKRGVANLRAFVEDQLARSAAQLRESESRLTHFKERSSITSLESDSREMLRKMTDAEVLYNAALAERADAQERLDAIRQALAKHKRDLVPTVTTVGSAAAQKLREKLMGLLVQQVELTLQKYPANHPQVVRLQEEIEETRKALAAEAAKLKAEDIADPITQIGKLQEESATLQIEVDGLKARAEALRQTVTRYRGWLDGLPDKEMELARLERERDVNQKVYMTLLEQREEILISEQKQIPDSRVIDRPVRPREPIEPRKALNLGMGAVLGLIAGFGLGFLLENRPGRVGSMLEFQRETGWPVLARVPVAHGGAVKWSWLRERSKRRGDAQPRRAQALVAIRDPESAAGESYNILRTQLELLGLGSKYRTLLVTSSGPRDGKSSTLSNLAASLGGSGRSTVVVDAELRRPVIHTIFGVDRAPGLTDVLLRRNGDGTGSPASEKAATPPHEGSTAMVPGVHSVLQESLVRGVAVVASGNQARESHREISWPAIQGVLDDLKKRYEVVLVDSAPPLLVHDTLLLCGMVDAVVVVVDARSHDAQRLGEVKLLLERAGAHVVGAVLNNADPRGQYVYGYQRSGVESAS